MELTQIESKLQKIKPELQNKFGIKKIGIFGSYVKGLQNDKSDIDIIVEIERPIGFLKFMKIQLYLSRVLKKSVDLLTFDSIKPYMQNEVLKDIKYV